MLVKCGAWQRRRQEGRRPLGSAPFSYGADCCKDQPDPESGRCTLSRTAAAAAVEVCTTGVNRLALSMGWWISVPERESERVSYSLSHTRDILALTIHRHFLLPSAAAAGSDSGSVGSGSFDVCVCVCVVAPEREKEGTHEPFGRQLFQLHFSTWCRQWMCNCNLDDAVCRL